MRIHDIEQLTGAYVPGIGRIVEIGQHNTRIAVPVRILSSGPPRFSVVFLNGGQGYGCGAGCEELYNQLHHEDGGVDEMLQVVRHKDIDFMLGKINGLWFRSQIVTTTARPYAGPLKTPCAPW